MGYRWGHHAPGLRDDRLCYQACHHLLLAHGLALPALRQHAPNAEHGIVLNFAPAYPATDKPEDIAVAKRTGQLSEEWFLQPLLNVQYFEALAETHPEWMPTQLPGDLDIISRPIDFLGINFYTRNVFKADVNKHAELVPQDAPKTDIGWEIHPPALTHLLLSLKQRYKNLPPIYITENGAADNTEILNGEINDTMRTDYYQQHLMAVHNAIEQGADVRGYFAWSLMDNFEWAYGYEMRFGIVHVNYQTLVRTVKKSGQYFQALLASRESAANKK